MTDAGLTPEQLKENASKMEKVTGDLNTFLVALSKQ